MMDMNQANMKLVNHITYFIKSGRLRFAVVDAMSIERIHIETAGEEILLRNNLATPIGKRQAQLVVAMMKFVTGQGFKWIMDGGVGTQVGTVWIRYDLYEVLNDEHPRRRSRLSDKNFLKNLGIKT